MAFASLLGADQTPEATLTELSPGVFVQQVPRRRKFVPPNQGFVVMSDRVVVIDPGSPFHARELMAQIRRLTEKPVRSVLVTHAHGDHLDGAFVFADLGAEIIGARAGQQEYETGARHRFARAQEYGIAGYEDARFVPPTRYFDDRLVIEDSSLRLELMHVGHGHTPGDAVAWLPSAGVLFTGDVCDNGLISSLASGDSGAWIAVLDRLILLGPKHVVAGHGPVSDGRVLEVQRRYLVELRAAVQEGLALRETPEQIAANLDLARRARWEQSPQLVHDEPAPGEQSYARLRNVERVYQELGGRLPARRPPLLSRRRAYALGLLALLAIGAARALMTWRKRGKTLPGSVER